MAYINSKWQPSWTKEGNTNGDNWRSLQATANELAVSGRDGCIDLMGRDWILPGGVTFDPSSVREIDGTSGGYVRLDLALANKSVDAMFTFTQRLRDGRDRFGKSALCTLNNVDMGVIPFGGFKLSKMLYCTNPESKNQEFSSCRTEAGRYQGADAFLHLGPNAFLQKFNGSYIYEMGTLVGRCYDAVNSGEQIVFNGITTSAMKWNFNYQWGVSSDITVTDSSLDYPSVGFVAMGGGGRIVMNTPHLEGRTTRNPDNGAPQPPFVLDNDSQLILVNPNLSWDERGSDIPQPPVKFQIYGDGARGGNVTIIDPYEGFGFDFSDMTKITNKPDNLRVLRGNMSHGYGVDLPGKKAWNLVKQGWAG